jgi:hypothetical protein
MYQNAAFLAAFLLIYSAVAGRDRTVLDQRPILFIGVGVFFGRMAKGYYTST